MNLQIKEPCSENWDTMKLGVNSRHCEVCVKNVQDFSAKTRYEILDYLLSNKNKSVCGRVRKSQLDFHQEELEVLIEELRFKKGNRPFAILVMLTLSLVACNLDENTNIEIGEQTESILTIKNSIKQIIDTVITPEKDTLKSCIKDLPKIKKSELIDVEETIVGEMIRHPDTDFEIMGDFEIESLEKDSNSVHEYAENMPEFRGGVDKLYTYLGNNIKYPKKARRDSIEGRVFVNFIVEKTGKLSNINILKGISKECDEEVKRVIREMPNWAPGNNKGKNVAVKMHIPVNFRLK